MSTSTINLVHVGTYKSFIGLWVHDPVWQSKRDPVRLSGQVINSETGTLVGIDSNVHGVGVDSLPL